MSGFISRIVQSVTGNKARLSALERGVRRLLRASEESALIGDGFAGAGALLHSLAGQQDVLVFEVTGTYWTGSATIYKAARLQAYPSLTPPYGPAHLGADSEDDTVDYFVVEAPGEPGMWVGCRGVAVHSNALSTHPLHSVYITIRSEASGFQAYILGAPVDARRGYYRWSRTPGGEDSGFYAWARDLSTRDLSIYDRHVFPPETPIWLRHNPFWGTYGGFQMPESWRQFWFSGFAEPYYGACEE